jgi:hypothetical protein
MVKIFGSEMVILPDELGSIRAGSEWCWEPLKIDSRCYIRVVSVGKKADDSWWVLSEVTRDGNGVSVGNRTWNELSRFVEAAVLVKAAA